ncbi:MAG: tetratricopeptide repeat protein [Polyangiaceae bacterium]
MSRKRNRAKRKSGHASGVAPMAVPEGAVAKTSSISVPTAPAEPGARPATEVPASHPPDSALGPARALDIEAPSRVADSTPTPARGLEAESASRIADSMRMPVGDVEAEGPSSNEDSSLAPMCDLDSRFFEPSWDPFDAEASLSGAARTLSAQAASRRARLTKWVQGAIAFSAALCGVALAKSLIAHTMSHGTPSRHDAPAGVAFASAQAPLVQAIEPASRIALPAAISAEAPALPPVESPEGISAEAPALPPVEAPAAISAEAPQPAPVAITAPAAIPMEARPALPVAARPALGGKGKESAGTEAARQRERARGALERGRIAAAIAAGQTATAMDPGDAEAWLILGAAYQQKGDLRQARRCYEECVNKGQRGPKGECAALLR